MVFQGSIDDSGMIIEKERLTHDQSIPYPICLSMNLRVVSKLHPLCLFGFTIRRMIHQIVYCQWIHPFTHVLMGKYDLKSVYLHTHNSATVALEIMAQFDGLIFIALYQTFDGKPNPALLSGVSESICDLANILIKEESWTPDSLTPCYLGLLPNLDCISRSEPMAKARALATSLPDNSTGITDCYINDIPPIYVDEGSNVERCAEAIALAIYVFYRPVSQDEPIVCDIIMSLTKLFGKGTMQDVKLILGWKMDIHLLTIDLSDGKCTCWNLDINVMLKKRGFPFALFETTVGRLEHVDHIIPAVRHFLRCIGHLNHKAKANGLHCVSFGTALVDDLGLHLTFLRDENAGISMNLLTYRLPTIQYRLDACPFGMGGYSLMAGRAWHIDIPYNLLSHLSLNTLEFLACVICI
jgi:hypothetical protein